MASANTEFYEKISILNRFVEEWKEKKFVEGIIISGSFITSFYSKYSDIDVFIIFSDCVNYRERGCKVINGVNITYYALPIKQVRVYFERDYRKHRKTMARILLMGKVLFDRNGIVQKLKDEAKRWSEKPLKKMENWQVELMKEYLWNLLMDLRDIYERNSLIFDFYYYDFLKNILKTYSRFLGVEIPPFSKLDRYFLDEKFRKEYMYSEFPDSNFTKMFIECLKAKEANKKIERIEQLYNYVINKMGGLDLNNWKVKYKLDF